MVISLVKTRNFFRLMVLFYKKATFLEMKKFFDFWEDFLIYPLHHLFHTKIFNETLASSNTKIASPRRSITFAKVANASFGSLIAPGLHPAGHLMLYRDRIQ